MRSPFWWLRRLRNLLDRLSLRHEMDDPQKVLQDVYRDAAFRGINLWVLVTATVVASIGLNVNSTPVIIGAMLISPLMGPINAVGISLAIYDIELLRKALRNLVVAIIFSVLSSALYFVLTPLKEAGSELWARTTPTFWDVLIAFFGGLSGVIAALGRERRVNVIAGVAIATALMPPLCTAGYGLGTLQPRFFFGALYLFLINSVFISASAYLTFQLIRFPNIELADRAQQLRLRRTFLAIILLTLLPSLYVAYSVVEEAFQEAQVRRFVENAFQVFSTTSVVEYKRLPEGDSVILRLVLFGEPLEEEQQRYLQHELRTTYGLSRYKLDIIQGSSTPRLLPEAARLLEATERSYSEIRRLTDSLHTLHRRLHEYEAQQHRKTRIAREIATLFPDIARLGLQELILTGPEPPPDTLLLVLLELPRGTRFKDERRLAEWLRERTGYARIHVLQLPSGP